MATLKSKIIRFFNKYIGKNLIICLLCLSSVLGITACCYPTAITKDPLPASGMTERDYLNSLFSGAIALTNLTTYELCWDYKFYDNISTTKSSVDDKMHTFYEYADRQYTAMAQFLVRAIHGIYGKSKDASEFLWFKWDNKFDILYPHWWINDPNAVYSNDIWTYYNTILTSEDVNYFDEPYTELPTLDDTVFSLNTKNPQFHYACANFQGFNYNFPEGGSTVEGVVKLVNNATSKSKYQANSQDDWNRVQIIPVWIPNKSRYMYYVVATERDGNGNQQYPYQSRNHLYSVLNANALSIDENGNSTNSQFLWWKFNDSYKTDKYEHSGFEAQDLSLISAGCYWNGSPNIKEISWSSSDNCYNMVQGIQMENSDCYDYSGNFYEAAEKYIDLRAPTLTGSDNPKKFELRTTSTSYNVDLPLIGKHWPSACFGDVYYNGVLVGDFSQGADNTYIDLKVPSDNNMKFYYFEYNDRYFPVNNNKNLVYGNIDDVLYTEEGPRWEPIFTTGNYPQYSYDSRTSLSKLTVKIDSTKLITDRFNHRKYIDSNGKSHNTMSLWQNGDRLTVENVKCVLAALNRYGTTSALRKAYGGYTMPDLDDLYKSPKVEFALFGNLAGAALNFGNYVYNIANTRSLGLSQYLYDNIISFLQYYIIGNAKSYSGFSGSLWSMNTTAKSIFFKPDKDEDGLSKDSPSIEVFSANADLHALSKYKGYEYVIPRIVGSMFSLYNTNDSSPYLSSRNTICDDLAAGNFESIHDYGANSTTLFPSLIASKVYTYGNVSALNMMYNYQNAIDIEPKEAKKGDVVNPEGVGYYKYVSTTKNQTEGGKPVPKSLYEYLYGVKKNDDSYTEIDPGTGNKIQYYAREDYGILDDEIVPKYRIRTLILFPKVTANSTMIKEMKENQKKEFGFDKDGYQDYICIDPTFIMSATGASNLFDGSTNTNVHFNVEVVGAYNESGAVGKITSKGKMYAHRQTVSADPGFSDISFTSKYVTEFMNIRGDDFYTDIAMLQKDADGNEIVDLVWSEEAKGYKKRPRYYLDKQFKSNKLHEYDSNADYYTLKSFEEMRADGVPILNADGTPISAEEYTNQLKTNSIRTFNNFTHEVYIYDKDYLYFKSDINNSKTFSLYNAKEKESDDNPYPREINSKYFIKASSHSDTVGGVKYDAYNIRSGLFTPSATGYVINSTIAKSYIRIDLNYYKIDGDEDPFNPDQYTSGVPTELIEEKIKYADESKQYASGSIQMAVEDTILGWLEAALNAVREFAEGVVKKFTWGITTDSDHVNVGKESVCNITTDNTKSGFFLFEISIYAKDCMKSLMSEQDASKFFPPSINNNNSFCVNFIEYVSGSTIGTINGYMINKGETTYQLTAKSNFSTWFNNGGTYNNVNYKDGVVSKFLIDGDSYSYEALASKGFNRDLDIYVVYGDVEYTVTIDYDNIQIIGDATKSWDVFMRDYSHLMDDYIKNTYTTSASRQFSNKYIKDSQDIFSVSYIDFGTAFLLDKWKRVDNGQYVATDQTLTINKDITLNPVLKLNTFNLVLSANGGQIEKSTNNFVRELTYPIMANTNVGSAITSLPSTSKMSHNQGFAFLGWYDSPTKSGNLLDIYDVQAMRLTTSDVTIYAVWDTTRYIVNIAYMSDYSSSDNMVDSEGFFLADGAYQYLDDDGVSQTKSNYEAVALTTTTATYLAGSQISEAAKTIYERYSDEIQKLILYNSKRYMYVGFTSKSSISGATLYTQQENSAIPNDWTINIFHLNDVMSNSNYFVDNNIFGLKNIGYDLTSAGTTSYISPVYAKLNTVSFNNKGNISKIYILNQATLNTGSKYYIGTYPNITGGGFRGWTTHSDPSTFDITKHPFISATDIKNTKLADNVTYYAVYDNAIITYVDEITGSTQTREILKGEVAPVLPVPSGALGWSTSNTTFVDANLGTVKVTGDTTYYAIYAYTVQYKYYLLGVEQTQTETLYNLQSASLGTSLLSSIPNAIGWSKSSNSTTTINLSNVSKENVTLYAVYSVTITYASVLGTPTPSPETLTYSHSDAADGGKDVILPSLAVLEYTDGNTKYTFEGWVISGTTDLLPAIYKANESVTIEAKYMQETIPTE